MKKTAMLVLMILMASSVCYAATTKETFKNESQKWGSFWSREGERSGLKQSTSSWGSFWTSANPATFFKKQQDNYNARKSGSYIK